MHSSDSDGGKTVVSLQVKRQSAEVWQFILDREIEAPARFQAIQTQRAAAAILRQQVPCCPRPPGFKGVGRVLPRHARKFLHGHFVGTLPAAESHVLLADGSVPEITWRMASGLVE